MRGRTLNRVAQVGDELVIDAHRVGEFARRGIVLDVREWPGAVSYLVRWDHNGHETVLYPGADCHVERLGDDLSSTRNTG